MAKSKKQKEQEFKEFIIMERISQLLEERQSELGSGENTMNGTDENHKKYENKENHKNNEEEIPTEWMEEQGQREMYLYEKGVEDGIKIMKKVMDCVSDVSRETML